MTLNIGAASPPSSAPSPPSSAASTPVSVSSAPPSTTAASTPRSASDLFSELGLSNSAVATSNVKHVVRPAATASAFSMAAVLSKVVICFSVAST